MELVRRTLLAGMAGGIAAVPMALAASPLPESRAVRARGSAGPDYAPALTALSAYARREIAFWGLPGMTLALVDAEGYGAVLTLGYADVERGIAVTPAHLFQIGSISKSFAAATLLGFVDEGRLDLEAPLARYLPELPLPPEPITVAQVLSHAAGLPDGAPVFPRTPEGRLWCGYPPGARFSYSNTGYELLGLLIARLGGAPHPAVIQRRLLAPLGMAATRPAILDRDRAAYAVGYAPLVTTRPFLPGQPLTPGPWTDMDAASGMIASTPDDMARYLRFLIAAARGQASATLSQASARRLSAPLIDAEDFGPKARYGLGLATVLVGGKPCLHHTGGMLTFASSMHIDGEAGVACFASVNAQLGNGYRPRLTTAYAVELMRAARGGKAAAAPDAGKATRIDRPGGFAGRYVAADGTMVELAARGADMTLSSAGKEGRLVSIGGVLATDHPNFLDAPFQVERGGDQATALWWHETLFRRGRQAEQPRVPDRIRALAGWYESSDPWIGGVILRARGDKLVMDSADALVADSGGVLAERDGYWTIGNKDTVERLRFDAPVDGRPSRLNLSGLDMMRRTFG